MPGVTLDTGALIAAERGEPRLQALLDEASLGGATIAIPAGVIAQAWRGSVRQARLARMLSLSAVAAVALDEATARASGALCGRRGTSDVIDASVVICARSLGHAVVTGDPDDLAALDPDLRLIVL